MHSSSEPTLPAQTGRRLRRTAVGTSSGGGRRGCVSTLLRVQLRCSEDGKARRETTLPYKEPDGKHRRDRATNDGLRATRIDRGTLEMTERQASLSRTPNGLALKEGGDGIAARPATVALSVRQPRPRLDAEDQRSAAGTVPHTHTTAARTGLGLDRRDADSVCRRGTSRWQNTERPRTLNMTIHSSGSLGSAVDEERSQLRYVM